MDLERFIKAQDDLGTYETALAELRAGRKRSHWMWFVFPQIEGLGQSPISRRFALASMAEAQAYLAHPVLGERLIESARTLTELSAKTAEEIFGAVDAMKLRSSMTLFALADADSQVFQEVLDRYFGGAGDPLTKSILERQSPR